MSKRFYIVTFLTLSMAVILLTATYSKTSGITKYVDTHIMKDKFAIIYEDSNYYNVKKVGRLDQYKDVDGSTITIINKDKIEADYALNIECNDCYNKVYYSINDSKPMLINDSSIYTSNINGYGTDGDVNLLNIKFLSLNEYEDRIIVNVSEQSNGLLSSYKDNEMNGYIKVDNVRYKIVRTTNNKVIAISFASVRTPYDNENNYIDEELLEYLEDNNPDIIKDVSFWLKDDKEYSNGKVVSAVGTSLDSFVIELNSNLEIVSGDGSITNPYEVDYES